MTTKLFFSITILTLLIFCSPHPTDHDNTHKPVNMTQPQSKNQPGKHQNLHNHLDEEKIAQSHHHLHIKNEILDKWKIEYARPEIRVFIEKINLTGTIKENLKKTFLVNSLLAGMVTAISKDIGDRVNKDDILCTLNSPELLNLKTRHIKSYQQYLLLKADYKRATALVKDKAIEEKELLRRETAYKTALANFYSIEAELHTLGFTRQDLTAVKNDIAHEDHFKLRQFISPLYHIQAPATGIVMSRDIRLGEQLSISKTIFEISDTSQIWAVLDVMEQHLKFINNGNPIEIMTDVYPEQIFKGNISHIYQKIDPKLRTTKIRAEINNNGRLLKPNMYIHGKVTTEMKGKFLAFPKSALIKMKGNDGIFIKSANGFEFKAVKITNIDADGFVFAQNINPEDQIIIKGAFYLKAEYEIQRGGFNEHSGHQH